MPLSSLMPNGQPVLFKLLSPAAAVAAAAFAVSVAVAFAFAVTVAVADTFGIPAALRQMAIR